MKQPSASSDATPRTLDRLISQPELLREYVPLDRSTIWRLVKSGGFPQPVRMGDRRLAWKEQDVQRWMDERSKASR